MCHGVHLDNKRFFLYVLMRTRLWVTEADERRDPSDMGGDGEKGTISSIFGLEDANVQTFRRPARSNRVLVMTPSALRAGLREALEHGKGAW